MNALESGYVELSQVCKYKYRDPTTF